MFCVYLPFKRTLFMFSNFVKLTIAPLNSSFILFGRICEQGCHYLKTLIETMFMNGKWARLLPLNNHKLVSMLRLLYKSGIIILTIHSYASYTIWPNITLLFYEKIKAKLKWEKHPRWRWIGMGFSKSFSTQQIQTQ